MVGSWSKVQGQSIAFAVLRQKHHNSFLPDHDEAMEEEIKEAIARSLALSGFKGSHRFPEPFSKQALRSLKITLHAVFY